MKTLVLVLGLGIAIMTASIISVQPDAIGTAVAGSGKDAKDTAEEAAHSHDTAADKAEGLKAKAKKRKADARAKAKAKMKKGSGSEAKKQGSGKE